MNSRNVWFPCLVSEMSIHLGLTWPGPGQPGPGERLGLPGAQPSQEERLGQGGPAQLADIDALVGGVDVGLGAILGPPQDELGPRVHHGDIDTSCGATCEADGGHPPGETTSDDEDAEAGGSGGAVRSVHTHETNDRSWL